MTHFVQTLGIVLLTVKIYMCTFLPLFIPLKNISINSSMFLMISMASKSPWKDIFINTSYILRQSIMAKISGRSVGMLWLGKITKLLFIFLFFYFSFILDLLHRRECRKVSYHKYHSHMTGSHSVTSHDITWWVTW